MTEHSDELDDEALTEVCGKFMQMAERAIAERDRLAAVLRCALPGLRDLVAQHSDDMPAEVRMRDRRVLADAEAALADEPAPERPAGRPPSPWSSRGRTTTPSRTPSGAGPPRR